ncbi:MAG: leucine-rich repeat domain-containing protein [Clostridia bacterium]|nr:leucine-rich repeat domain-containing protein [Clostridia bacterium]
MKKRIFLMTVMVAVLVYIFVISASAEVVTYDDAPAKDKLTASTDDVVVFDDGFTCPSAYIFKDTDTVAGGDHTGKNGLQYSVDFTYINKKTGETYDISRIVEIDIPEGIKTLNGYAFTRLTIKRVSIPKTVTGIGGCCFEKCSSLEQCVFEHTKDSELQSLPAWIFQGCTSLTAFCFPECITKISAEYEFSGCTNLTAVYLPKNLTAYNTSGNDGKSVFWNCEKMYFVNEPFTYDNIPQKPSIYYMPSGLTSVSGELFKQCKNLNETIVFPVGVTTLTNGWAFKADSSTVKNVVFLGDMTALNTSSWKLADGAKIIFANANDTDSSSLSSLSGSHTKIYCASETDLSKHVAEKTLTVDATCDTNKATNTYCFCGKIIAAQEEDGTMLGHEYDVEKGATLISMEYVSYDKAGKKIIACAKCSKHSENEIPALFICQGYSSSKTGVDGIAVGFTVNNVAIAEYEEITGKTLRYGVFAVSQSKLGSNDVFDKDGKAVNGVINAEITSHGFAAFELKVVGFTDEYKDTKLAMGAYVAITDGEATEYSYMQGEAPADGDNYHYVSYNEVISAVIPE